MKVLTGKSAVTTAIKRPFSNQAVDQNLQQAEAAWRSVIDLVTLQVNKPGKTAQGGLLGESL